MSCIYMITDNEGKTYINNCGQDYELLEMSPEDYFYSKYRTDDGRLSAESILSKFSKNTLKEKGYKLTKFVVGITKKEDADWGYDE